MSAAVAMDDPNRGRRIRAKNRALLLALLGLVALFYLISLVRMGVWS